MLPLFEAIVNSIHSIEDDAAKAGKPLSDYLIEIEIIRAQDMFSAGTPRGEWQIAGFRIKDDGAGFHGDNWKSFNTLDTLYKAERGSRGIGRLTWLKAFTSAEVESVYREDGVLVKRSFSFQPKDGVVPRGVSPSDGPIGTAVQLAGFLPRYAQSAPKSSNAIASAILEHCLWYFVRDEGVPRIVMLDGPDTVDLDDLYDAHMHADAYREAIEIRGHSFEIVHVKFRTGLNKPNTLNYCAAGRLVRAEPLKGQIAALTSRMSDADGDFTYAAYLTSSYLDENVLEQRIDFTLRDVDEDIFGHSDIGFPDIREAVIPRVRAYLEESLKQNAKASALRIDEYVSKRVPRYRPILKYIASGELIVDPTISDRDLDLALHRQVYKLEEGILRDGHHILVPLQGETEDAYQGRVEDYLTKVSDLKQSDLANYVMHRRIILDLLAAAIYRGPDGKFANEDRVHELIVPMQKTSTDYEFRRENLWLVDERLAFHDFLASDLPLSSIPITSDASGREPDIASLRVFDIPILVAERTEPPASLTVVELKKPMRKAYKPGEDNEHDPILQSLDYLRRLRDGTATRRGRPIPNADRIPGYIYVVADLTDKLIRSCDLLSLTRSPDGLGYFGFLPKPSLNAYVQVLSYDAVLRGATERNRAFFDKLGLPT